MGKKTVAAAKPRVLTAAELKLVEELSKALLSKALAEEELKTSRRLISKLTDQINDLDITGVRGRKVWLEAMKKLEEARAPKDLDEPTAKIEVVSQ